MSYPSRLWAVCLTCLTICLGCAPHLRADTAVGDWGHFLSLSPRIYMHNPDGKAFTFTVHVMRWPKDGWWNTGDFPMRVTDPAGKVIMEDQFKVEDNQRTFDVPAGAKGTYIVEMTRRENKQQMINVWLSSTLERSVVWTGKPEGGAFENQWLVTQCTVPRTWWFWVPADTTEFTVRTQRDIGNTEREDPGITIISPRGQRITALFGQAIKEQRLWAGDKKWRDNLTARVPVEPGNAGRFWAMQIRLGDSHNYSKVNVSLEGVPPYVARSPEEWFDPTTGDRAPVQLYDEALFMQAVPDEKLRFQMWSPSPSLGDPDGVEVLGEGRIALWNPQDRPLRFDIGDYITRDVPDADGPPKGKVTITGAAGKTIFDQVITVPHHHNGARQPMQMPATGKGVAYVTVADLERWFAYTYPATPLVWLGKETDDGFHQFTMEVGTARNWYFFVPLGIESFTVRTRCAHEDDVADVRVNAADRTMAIIYGHEGTAVVKVPKGLDGKIWHLRTDVGSATRIETRMPPQTMRYLGIGLTLELKGVPGLLAPTWEQWFDPQNPRHPHDRLP